MGAEGLLLSFFLCPFLSLAGAVFFEFCLAENARMEGNEKLNEVDESANIGQLLGPPKVFFMSEWTYATMMVTANSDLACRQYPIFDGYFATLQLFVINHGAPGCGRRGSVMSEPAWNRAATMNRAIIEPWTKADSGG